MTVTPSSSSYTTYLLSELRCAALRGKLMTNEILAMGVALDAGWIDPDTALAHLRDTGAIWLVSPTITSSSSH